MILFYSRVGENIVARSGFDPRFEITHNLTSFMRKIVRKLCNPLIISELSVVLGRIELPTHGFSVHCSTI